MSLTYRQFAVGLHLLFRALRSVVRGSIRIVFRVLGGGTTARSPGRNSARETDRLPRQCAFFPLALIPRVIPGNDGAPWPRHDAAWSPAAVSAMPVSAGSPGVIWAARTPSGPVRPAGRWLRAGSPPESAWPGREGSESHRPRLFSRQADQPLADVVGQGYRSCHIEPQPDGRGDLVDVLTTRAGSTNELEPEFCLVEHDAVVDGDHGSHFTVERSSRASASIFLANDS